MAKTPYAHLGSFGDFVEVAKAQKPLFPIFGFTAQQELLADARLERSWRADGVGRSLKPWARR
jgi:hypothetical protein